MGFLNKKGRPFRNEKGALRQIYQWFIKPMLDHAPRHIEDEVYLEALWGVKQKVFTLCRAAKSFNLPGLYLEVANTKFFGRGDRQIWEGDMLLTRRDPVLGRVHVSVLAWDDDDELTFELTEQEWSSIKRFVTEVEDPCNHLPST